MVTRSQDDIIKTLAESGRNIKTVREKAEAERETRRQQEAEVSRVAPAPIPGSAPVKGQG